jgi:hypothetical protein
MSWITGRLLFTAIDKNANERPQTVYNFGKSSVFIGADRLKFDNQYTCPACMVPTRVYYHVTIVLIPACNGSNSLGPQYWKPLHVVAAIITLLNTKKELIGVLDHHIQVESENARSILPIGLFAIDSLQLFTLMIIISAK